MTTQQAITRDRNGLAILDRRECLRLLASEPIGRVAITIGALPVILPVNYTVTDREEIVFRTGVGQKLRAALDGAVVAFEVDAFDHDTRTGWSVLVQDRARVVGPSDAQRFLALPLDSWAGIEPADLVVLSTELISGRRLDHEDR